MSTIQQMKDLVGRWHRRGDPDCADELALLVEKVEGELRELEKMRPELNLADALCVAMDAKLDAVRKLAEQYKASCGNGWHEQECCACDFAVELLAILDSPDAELRELRELRVRRDAKKEIINALKNSNVLSWQDAGRFLEKHMVDLNQRIAAREKELEGRK